MTPVLLLRGTAVSMVDLDHREARGLRKALEAIFGWMAGGGLIEPRWSRRLDPRLALYGPGTIVRVPTAAEIEAWDLNQRATA